MTELTKAVAERRKKRNRIATRKVARRLHSVRGMNRVQTELARDFENILASASALGYDEDTIAFFRGAIEAELVLVFNRARTATKGE